VLSLVVTSRSAERRGHLELAAEIVSAYVASNSLPQGELPALLRAVHDALNRTAAGKAAEPAPVLAPAVPVKKSVTPDYIVCLDDGKKFKSLKRHLRTQYNMTPEQYREKWGLPADYPMAAPNYAKARSELARSFGFGQQRKVLKSARERSATKARAATKAAARPLKVTSPAPRRGRKAH
jgi:predicted transcriptional regulator